MATITLPKAQYDLLKKRASLYENMLRSLPERKWAIEDYSSARIREFMQSDKLDQKTAKRIKKLLRSSKPR